MSQIRKELDKGLQRVEKAMIQLLRRLGEKCVIEARDNGGYTDRTGNLRSSIGYVIVANGEIVELVIKEANKDENGKGQATGREYATELAKGFPKGFALIVVAGMDYAAKVESLNKNVLTSAEAYAEREMPKMLERIRKNIDKIAA